MSTNPNTSATGLANPPFVFSGNRNEVTDVQLQIIDGKFPDKIHGLVYLMT